MEHLVFLIGNLGNDPELRTTTSGTPVANFRMATTRVWRDKEGNKNEETVWWSVQCFGNTAENVYKYLKKGRQVYVRGQMVPNEDGGPKIWTDRDGNPRANFEIRAHVVRFLGGAGDASAGRDASDDDDDDEGPRIPW